MMLDSGLNPRQTTVSETMAWLQLRKDLAEENDGQPTGDSWLSQGGA